MLITNFVVLTSATPHGTVVSRKSIGFYSMAVVQLKRQLFESTALSIGVVKDVLIKNWILLINLLGCFLFYYVLFFDFL